MSSPSRWSRLRLWVDSKIPDRYHVESGGRLYAAYELDGEYVGCVKPTLPEVTAWLRIDGWDNLRLSAAKTHPDTGELAHADYRLVDPHAPRYQYHVHLWPCLSGGTSIHCHRELRPDPHKVADESVRDVIDRLRGHYTGRDYSKADRPVALIEYADSHGLREAR